jgi:hypothetical protein
MVKEKMKKQFCGLSNEEKALIKEKKDDIKLDLSIKCFGYPDIYEIYCEDGLEPILDVLEEHLPFIKEQKELMLEIYEETDGEIDDTELDDFVNDLYNIIGSLEIDASKINPKIFERAKVLTNDDEDYYSFFDELFENFVDMLYNKSIEQKIEILKIYSQKNK